MPTSGKNSQRTVDRRGSFSILVVSPQSEDYVALNRMFGNRVFRFASAASVADARFFVEHNQPEVVVTERDLPDGDWADVLIVSRTSPLVVASRQADDELWTTVLNIGGYDVLRKPFEPDEVVRVLSMATFHSQRRRPAGRASLEYLAANVH
ncbi:MAG TPA: hypothetical protein VE621_05390 [Bryobacteraceae bacterium]|jgi:DNA-binding response OmpR family regulator|nr:hypothetical protein [Bryobacteraceae bacterium]